MIFVILLQIQFLKNINFIRSRSNDVLNVSHPKRLILLTLFCVGLCYLREHKFKCSFLDRLNPICIYGFGIETLNHFFLHCPRFTKPSRQKLLLKIERKTPDIFRKACASIFSILLYGDPSFSVEFDTNILNILIHITYIVFSKRFEFTAFTKTWFVT